VTNERRRNDANILQFSRRALKTHMLTSREKLTLPSGLRVKRSFMPPPHGGAYKNLKIQP
jgi:hypothetical protein